MKKVLLALAVAAVSGLALAETKTWPADYWQTMLETESAQRPKAATDSLKLAEADADAVSASVAVPLLDTFLFAIFDAENSLTGLSTMMPGSLLFLR